MTNKVTTLATTPNALLTGGPGGPGIPGIPVLPGKP